MAGEIKLNSVNFASESGGTITVNTGTLGSGVVFPAGHIIQTVSQNFATYTLFSSSTYAAIASNAFEKAITTSVTNSQILVTIFLSGAGTVSATLAALQLKITESVTSLDQKLDDLIGYATDTTSTIIHPATLVYLHAPAQSSGTTLTYIPQFAARNDYINSAFINSQLTTNYGSTLLLQEIAP
jgi:low affinity Fe/Cu permease